MATDARILVIARALDRPRSEGGLLDAFRADHRFELREVASVDESSARIREGGSEYDAIVVFLKFAELRAAEPITWQGYDGLRVLYDHDALNNYSTLGSFQGEWPRTFARHHFDLLVCTGRRTAERLRDDGISAEWVPKGYDPRLFFDTHRSRDGTCTYGTRYPARAAMKGYVRSKGIDLVELNVPYLTLNEKLNEFAACVVCNLDGKYRFGKFGRKAAKVQDGRFARRLLIRALPSFEVMLKNYEAAAAGCVVFCDPSPELDELGFVDGRTTVVYDDFQDLVEKLESYARAPSSLEDLGVRAAALCVERHTWAHRVDELSRAVDRHL